MRTRIPFGGVRDIRAPLPGFAEPLPAPRERGPRAALVEAQSIGPTEAMRRFEEQLEQNVRRARELANAKELERLKTAQLIVGLGSAAAALVNIIRGTQGGGFLGVVGSLASLAGGFAATLASGGAASPLLAASLTAGGAVVSSLASSGRGGGGITPVTVTNPREIAAAIREIQGPLRVINQLVAPTTGEVIREIQFEIGRNERLGTFTPVPMGTRFGG